MAFTVQPRKNTYLRIDGKIFYVNDRLLKTQGRQGGLIILKLKSLDTGNNSEVTIKSGSKVEEVETETKEVQYLYSDESAAYFMDTTTFETVTVSMKMIGDYKYFLKEGERTLVLLVDGVIIDIRRKASVELTVVQATDAVKGNTANNALKEVALETGYKVNVPMFVKEGDVITVNTDTGEYTGRVSN
ncbi:MAG: Elongation factor P [candidate division WS6 bacterium GW2011_GWF2_39_15]|uniref:Elongation factor P n=1 Tax=candidate division WS6 bacterium GW2011_GWF2_39_15 TaxID=1619100 RepID=A0A0G0Q7K6_9BACT|nr:MAG: Elongation factor P [candidate division WS6 bacterium GW2011_GWF2_39_15]